MALKIFITTFSRFAGTMSMNSHQADRFQRQPEIPFWLIP